MRLGRGTARCTILAAGDLCPIHRLEAPLARGDAAAVFGDTLPLFRAADIAAVNLESPLCATRAPIRKCGPNFGVEPKVADGLKAAGIDLAWLANNHVMDQGPQGLAETLAALDARGIRHQGAGASSRDAARPILLTRRGVRLAFVNFAEGEFSLGKKGSGSFCAQHPSGLQAKGPRPLFPTAAPLDPVANTAVVRRLAQGGRVVIASVHSGNELVLFPSPLIRQRYRELIDAGAAAVLGHHPHVPQGIEVYRARPIVYSLGNFLFDWPEHEPETYASFLVELGVSAAGVERLAVHPFVRALSGKGVRPPAEKGSDPFSGAPSVRLLHGKARQAFVDWLREVSAPLTDPDRVTDLWEQEVVRIFPGRYHLWLRNMPVLIGDDEKARREAAPGLFNIFNCEAHREALATAFRMIFEERFRSDREAQSYLADLMTRLKNFC